MSAGKPPVGVLGTFVDLTLNCGRRTWVMHVELPFDAWDPVTRGIGLPQPAMSDGADPDPVRGVAILSCRVPLHPEREGDVLLEAAMQLATALLRLGYVVPVSAKTDIDEGWHAGLPWTGSPPAPSLQGAER